jgi:iron complex transport system ATP-binding protein
LLLREGSVVAQGLLRDTITSENLSKTFGLPLRVTMSGGRFTARAA